MFDESFAISSCTRSVLICGMITAVPLVETADWSPSLDSSVLELLSLSMFMPSLLVSGGFSEEINLAGTDEGNTAHAATAAGCLEGVCNFDDEVADPDAEVDVEDEDDGANSVVEVGVSVYTKREVGGIGGGCCCLPWSKLNCFFNCIARGGGCTCAIIFVVPKSREVDTSSVGRFISEAPTDEVRNG